MDKNRDYFKRIDFDKPWDEDDWERFFRAQERLTRESAPGPAFGLSPRRRGLAFRDVLKRFGMDPDNPGSAPGEFDLYEPSPAAGRAFWEEGAELENLPIYCQAKCYAVRAVLLCDRRLGRLLTKSYKSASHRRWQAAARELQEKVGLVSRDIAAGHQLGYGREAVKGNIARCKRALAQADACVGLVTRLPRKRFSAGEYGGLVRDTLRLRHDLMGWIAALRRRFV